MMVQKKTLIYEGIRLPKKAEEKGLPPYVPSKELIKAVNLAIFLERPLLLMGEPGCGKTRLAEMVACELDLPYTDWYIKSTSKAKDGLYRYDALRRLHDAQVVRSIDQESTINDPGEYVDKKALWFAFRNAQRTVVLIDEIDKADIDFANDLLRELEEKKFTVEETGEEIIAKNSPIIFITSNGEKPLPNAFLRRCLFHYIEFPDAKRLTQIAEAHLPDASTELASAAVERFIKLRDKMQQDKGDTGKKPSTSEFLDWLKVLILGSKKPDSGELIEWFSALFGGSESFDIISILESGELPFYETLLKDKDDYSDTSLKLP